METFHLNVTLYGNRKLSINVLYSHGIEQHARTIHFLHGSLTIKIVHTYSEKLFILLYIFKNCNVISYDF
jgi:hypothetical protein